MNFDQEIFCTNVKYLRELKGYNKYEMSIQANIIYQYYCDLENGKKVPNFKSVIYIANALSVDIGTLLGNRKIDTENDATRVIKLCILAKIKTLTDDDTIRKINKFAIMLKARNKEGDIRDD